MVIVIRAIRDKLGVRSNMWLDIEHMAQLVDDYNNAPQTAFIICLLLSKFNLLEIWNDIL
jgi:hypothetical protein